MKVRVNEDVCDGNGFCVVRAPEVFRLRDDDTLEVLLAEPPESMRAAVEEARRSCPKAAISVE